MCLICLELVVMQCPLSCHWNSTSLYLVLSCSMLVQNWNISFKTTLKIQGINGAFTWKHKRDSSRTVALSASKNTRSFKWYHRSPCTNVCVCGCVCGCVCVCVCVFVCESKQACESVQARCVYVSEWVCGCMCACMQVCKWFCVCMCVCVCQGVWGVGGCMS